MKYTYPPNYDKLLAAIFVVMCLSSCYSAKKATKQVISAQTSYPNVVRNACALYYPSKDSLVREISYLKGKTDTFKSKPIIIDCDSVVAVNKAVTPKTDKKKKKNNNSVVVWCPPSTNTVDTFRDYSHNYYEDTKKVGILTDSIFELNNLIIEQNLYNKIVKEKLNKRNEVLIAMTIILALVFLSTFIKIKFL